MCCLGCFEGSKGSSKPPVAEIPADSEGKLFLSMKKTIGRPDRMDGSAECDEFTTKINYSIYIYISRLYNALGIES